MEGDSGLDVLSNDGILDIIPASEYDPFEVNKYVFNSLYYSLIYVLLIVTSDIKCEINHLCTVEFIVKSNVNS